jgi:hypothetical protein
MQRGTVQTKESCPRDYCGNVRNMLRSWSNGERQMPQQTEVETEVMKGSGEEGVVEDECL